MHQCIGRHDDNGVIYTLDDLSDTFETHSPTYTKNQNGQQIAKMTFSAFKVQGGTSKRQFDPSCALYIEEIQDQSFQTGRSQVFMVWLSNMEVRAI